MAEEKKEERLNNDEFRLLIPTLKLEDLFITEIKLNEEWMKMYKNLKINNKEIIYCNLCKKHVELESFKLHLKEQTQTHLNALKDVKQYFHPVYTYLKKNENLAVGGLVSDKEMTEAIKAAKNILDEHIKSINFSEAKRLSQLVENLVENKIILLQVDEIMKIVCFRNAQKFSLILESRNDFVRCNLCLSNPFNDFEELNVHFKDVEHIQKSKALKAISLEGCPEVNRYSVIQADVNSEYATEYNKILISLLEKEKVNAPHMMRIFCDLGSLDILKLKYLKNNTWNQMFQTLSKSSIKCIICNKTIINSCFNSHCKEKQHKAAQLKTQVQHKVHKNISNSYIFCLGSAYKVKTSLKARKKYHKQVLQILNKEKKVKVAELKAKIVTEEDEDKNIMETEEIQTGNGTENESGNETENEPEANPNVTFENENEQLQKKTDSGNVEIQENERDCDDEENETAENYNETENIEEPTETNGNDDTAQQTELPIKIAAKAKALRDAILNDDQIEASAKKSSSKNSNIHISSENISPDNALIGVEYVVKIFKHPNDQEPMFECCLCEVVMNHQRMQNHLTGYNHRYKYCEMHYGNAFNKFSASLKGVKYYDMFRTMGPILSKLALEIEKANGRSIPYTVSSEEFQVDRSRIIAQLYGDKHACQLFGPSFTNILSDEDIKKILAEKDTFDAPNTVHKGAHCRFLEISRGQTYCNIKLKSERKVVFNYCAKGRDEKERFTSRGLAGKFSKRLRAESPPRRESSTNNVWNKYRREILLSASGIECDYEGYRKCPDSHPLYNQEWNRFWKERKYDLVSRGIDPRNYNFQPDWVPYFKNRLEELFGEALEQAKIDVRIRLNIPLDAIEDSIINTAPFQQGERLNRIGHQSRAEPRLEKVSMSTRREPPEKKHRIDTESLVMQWNSQANFGQNQSRNFKQENRKVNNERSYSSTLRAVDEKPDLVHVLRLVTAFEDYLGSLGPKITDLLFSTLILEKQIPNDTKLLEQQILTPNNCSLLETAMEKLKGTLLAGLLDSAKEPGLHKVVNCTTNLLTYADSMGYLKQFPTAQDASQGNSQLSSNIQELMNIMTGVKGTVSNRLNDMNDFSGSNPYASSNTGNRFPDFQNQQFGNMRSSSEVNTNNNAPRENFPSSQLSQRSINMPGLGGNVPGNLNMANIGSNNYNNPNLNNQNANNNDRNYSMNKGTMQNTGPMTGYWEPFSGENNAASVQRNSSGRMWQHNNQNNSNTWQSGSGMSGLPQQNFRQQQQRHKR